MLRRIWLAVGAVLIGSVGGQVYAEGYPSKPIELIVPYPAGGGSDTVGRVMANHLSKRLGQPVIVVNKSGAGGALGAGVTARAAPDGYTLLLGSTGPNAISPSMVKSIAYSTERDFTAISLVATQPLFVLVKADSPYKTMADLVEAGRRAPGKLNFSSSGTGGLSHLAGEMISISTGSKFTHVPYKGGAPAMLGILSGEVTFHTPSAVDGVAQTRGGKMRALAVTSERRWPAAPDVPTVGEIGFPELKIDFWYGLFGPAGLPPDVLATLSKATKEVLEDPEVQKEFEKMGSVPAPTTPDEFARLVSAETKRYAKLIKDAGIQPQ